MRIAGWSGPRNLSTAMMYAFAARGDCAVMDEPFYAAWLQRTGADHPMAAEIIAAHQTDPDRVAKACREVPCSVPHLYMKHMPHHMDSRFPLDWAEGCAHLHLIRHPARVIASYTAKKAKPNFEEIGFAAQARIFDRLGGVVVDTTELRADPPRYLTAICDALGLAYTDVMLRWPAGGRPEDGVWAQHWYGAIHRSTGFAGPEGPLPRLDGETARLADAAMPHYEAMAARRIRP